MAILVKDSFNRANNANSLGVAETGQTWKYTTGSVFGILDNGAVCYSNAPVNTAYIDSLPSNVKLTVKAVQNGDWSYYLCAFRINPANNSLFILNGGGSSGGIKLQWYSGSTYTDLATITGTLTANDIFVVNASGSTIEIYRNSVKVATVTNTNNQTATSHGLVNPNAQDGALWDDFQVEDLAPPPTDTQIDAGTISFNGGTTFTATGNQRLGGKTASFSGDNSLTANGSAMLNSKDIPLSGDSSVTGDGSIIKNGIVSLDANTSFSADPSLIANGESSFSSDSELITSHSVILNGDSVLGAEGVLTALNGLIVNSGADMSAENNLAAEGSINTIGLSVNLSAGSDLSAVATVIVNGNSNFSASTDLTAVVSQRINGDSSFSALSDLIAEGDMITLDITANFSSVSSFDAEGLVIFNGQAVFSSTSDFSATGNQVLNTFADFVATSSLAAFMGVLYRQIAKGITIINQIEKGKSVVADRASVKTTLIQKSSGKFVI